MHRKDITYLQVKSTADKILTTGEMPTIARVYRLLGDIGCRQLIAEYLRQWRKEHSAELKSLRQNAPVRKEVEALTAKRTQALKKSLSIVRATLESTADGIVLIDNDDHLIDFNQKFVEISGIEKNALEKGDEGAGLANVLDLLESPEETIQLVMELKEDPNRQGDMGEVKFKDGRIIERYSQPHRIGNKIEGRVWSFRDVTKRRKAEEGMLLRERAIQASSQGVMLIANNTKKEIIYVNPAVKEITGYLEKELVGNSFEVLKGFDENEAEWERVRLTIKEEHGCDAVLKGNKKNGNIFWNEMHITPVSDAQENISHFVVILNDITERKAMERQLIHQATHDALTDLPNRILIEDRIRQMILYGSRTSIIFAVLFLDLDRFKIVNDSLGHKVGDDLLKSVANRLKKCLRDADTVARVGGDEFVILLPQLKKAEDSIVIAEKVLKTLRKPMRLSGQDLNVATSIGISCYPRDGEDASTLIRNADTAMYKAKESGRDNYKFYAAHMNKTVTQQLEISNHLHRALSRGEFRLAYQPVINLATQRITGVEALIRWDHPQLGEVSPLDFIYIAEETGLIVPIGRWVLETACQQNMAWIKQGLPPIQMSVNVSARQLTKGNFNKTVRDVLEKTGMPAKYLVLELTESMLMDGTDVMIKALEDLKELGLKIAIDDFGTGYSSLSYLKSFPVDKIKIDRAFVSDIGSHSDDAAIILAIVGMSKSLNLVVVAEGAERKQEVDFLRESQCDELQGFYFSKPLDKDLCTLLMQENFGQLGKGLLDNKL